MTGGYWAKGRLNTASPPASVITIDSTRGEDRSINEETGKHGGLLKVSAAGFALPGRASSAGRALAALTVLTGVVSCGPVPATAVGPLREVVPRGDSSAVMATFLAATFIPGRTRCRPLTTTRSPASAPSR